MSRITTREVEIGGVTIPENRMVVPELLAANHDERQFADPQRFDPRRARNYQLAFGHGINFCLGAPLARLEGQRVLDILLSRFADIRITPDATIAYHREGLTGAKNLPVTVAR